MEGAYRLLPDILNGPQGWLSAKGGPGFLLPAVAQYSLIGRLGGAGPYLHRKEWLAKLFWRAHTSFPEDQRRYAEKRQWRICRFGAGLSLADKKYNRIVELNRAESEKSTELANEMPSIRISAGRR